MTRPKSRAKKIGTTLRLEGMEGNDVDMIEVDTYNDRTACIRSYEDAESDMIASAVIITQKQANELVKKIREITMSSKT